MDDRLRVRTPSGAGAEPAAQLEELGGRSADLVRTQTTQRQEMAEGLAISTWHAGLSAAGCAGAVARRAAVQRAGGTASSISTLPADSRVESGTRRSAACLAAVCRTAADDGTARPGADGDANAFRIRRSGTFAAACSGSLGIYAALRARPLRRGALQYHATGTIAGPDSNDSPRTLSPQVRGTFQQAFFRQSGLDVPCAGSSGVYSRP